MMEKNTNKLHYEFDYNLAEEVYSQVEQYLSGELITSPFDLYSVETLRKRHGISIGEAIDSDVFVFSKGPAPDRRMTRVSGLPFYPNDKEWPCDENGIPFLFLAQFNFADSKDIVLDTPGDLLLLFVPQNGDEWIYGEGEICFKWIKSFEIEPIANLPSNVCPYHKTEWYGVIYRSADYPDGKDAAYKIDTDQSYNLPIFNGTKIGGYPFFIQASEDIEGFFLCQLGSIQAAHNVYYPWANKKNQMDLSFSSSGIYAEENQLVFGDMGNIYIFTDEMWNCQYYIECY